LENYKCILQEGILVHFKSVCDCSYVGGSGVDNVNDLLEKNNNGEDYGDEDQQRMVQCQLYKLETLLKLTTYYERMQTCKLWVFVSSLVYVLSSLCMIYIILCIDMLISPPLKLFLLISPYSHQNIYD